MFSRLHAPLKYAAILPFVALWTTAISADAPVKSLNAPKGGITPVYDPATGTPNRVSFINAQGREIFSQDYSGSVYLPGAGQWTASGRFFVYPLLSRNHQAIFTNDRFDIIDVKTLRMFTGDELSTGSPTTSEFKLSKQDTITFYEVDLEHDNRLVPHSLSLSETIPSLGGESLVGIPSEKELKPYYEAARAAQKTGVCNIHKVPMKKTLVPIAWGLFTTDIGPLPSTEIRFFPHAQDHVNGGCEVDLARENAQVPIYICPDCQRAQWRWIKEHPQDPWSKSWIQRHKTSKRAMEPTASRRTIQLSMISSRQSVATRALARGSSSCSR